MDSSRRWRCAVAALGVGTMLNPLNSSMLAVGLVALHHELQVSIADVAWVVTVFYLTSAVAQPVMGRVADVIGPRRVFTVGMGLVAIASLLAPIRADLVTLCVARVLLSIGTASAYPAALAIIRAHVGTQAGAGIRDIARIQLGNSIGVVLGPVVGGLVLTLLSWQFLFWISCPLALAAAVVLRMAPADSRSARSSSTLAALDPLGAVLFGAAVVPVLAGVSIGGRTMSVLVAVGVVSAIALVRHSRSASNPFLDIGLLASRRALPLYLGFWLMTTVYYCVFYGLPQYLELVMGMDPAEVGFIFMPLAAVAVAANPLVARALVAFSIKRVLLVGIVWMVLAAALLLTLSPAVHPVVPLAVCAVLGVPHCLSTLGYGAAVYEVSPSERVGVASGLLQTGRHLGGSTALALLGVVFAAGVDFAALARLTAVITACCFLALAVTAAWRPEAR